MPQIYLHYFGNESSENLLEAFGIMPKGQQIDNLRPKQCPNCNEPNKPDSKFCAKCRMVLTYDAYSETIEEKQKSNNDLESLKQQNANTDVDNWFYWSRRKTRNCKTAHCERHIQRAHAMITYSFLLSKGK